MSNDNYPKRYRAMLKYLGINNTHVAKETGLNYSHVRDVTSPNTKKFARWARLAVWVFERMKEENDQLKINQILNEMGANEEPIAECEVRIDRSERKQAMSKSIKNFKPEIKGRQLLDNGEWEDIEIVSPAFRHYPIPKTE